ncbi:MAG: outer membrane protein assembly factor BamD [Xanthomonadaceae bacterium]|nr:outer membrane protein assembly factor BamD [Xanthomonadaceae bacterium]MDE1886341.1 outer membrane protein assembly factor BamD [Xanthomonadaceae bacterium]MDE2084780.1 outer membrane protein assembly factor BamD [Xanthomonadaceae bacterium]MDE2257732.1 outer membrane protein assembly factor BamD [Xanthomonadaceae bacterium]
MRFSTALKLFCLSALLVLAACHRGAKKGDETEYLPVDQMYGVAKAALEDGNLSKAIKYDQRLIARFPFGPYTEQATLDLAYAQYKDDKREDAYSTINRFIKTYPAQKHVDYAYYLRGVINFDRDRGFLDRYANQDMTKRDQSHTLQSFEDFNDLLARFPNSRYADDARQRMIYLRDNLARGQLNIAEFYLREGAYVAAANRAQDIIEKFQRTPAVGDALAIQIVAYKKLGQDKLAADAERVLKLNYPNHPYFAGNWPKHPHWWWRMIPFRG